MVNRYIVFLLFLNVFVHFTVSLPMPLVEANLRAPLIVDIDTSKMNQELKKYIDKNIEANVNVTCYYEIDKMVTNKHNELSQNFKLKFQELEQNLNEDQKKQLDRKSSLLSDNFTSLENNIESKFGQLEQRFINEIGALKKQLEEKNKEQTLKIHTDNDRLHTRINNVLADSKKKYDKDFSSLKQGIDSKFKQLEQTFASFKAQSREVLNDDIDDLKNKFKEIHTKFISSHERVTMMACRSSDHTYTAGQVFVFNSVYIQVGISDLSFKTSGKFRCEKPGLYLVSVWILSKTKSSRFNLYKNGNSVFSTYNPNSYDRSTVVVTVELNVNDTVWVQTDRDMEVDGWGSCMTVTKIH